MYIHICDTFHLCLVWDYGFHKIPWSQPEVSGYSLLRTLSKWKQNLAKLSIGKVAKDHFNEYTINDKFKIKCRHSQSLPNLFAIKALESVSSSTDKCWRLDSLWEKGGKNSLINSPMPNMASTSYPVKNAVNVINKLHMKAPLKAWKNLENVS